MSFCCHYSLLNKVVDELVSRAMFEKVNRGFLLFFKLYGILPKRNRPSMFVPVALLSISGIYIWLAAEFDMISFNQWTREMSFATYYFSKCLLVLMELSILFVSLCKTNSIDAIYEEFNSFDFMVQPDLERIRRSSRNKILFVLLITLSFIAVYLCKYLNDDPSFKTAVLEVILVHMINVKGISFMFFVDALNERIESFVDVTKSGKVTIEMLTFMHHKLYQILQSINVVYGATMSVLIFFYCTSVAQGFYQFFVAASGIQSYYYSPYGE